MIQRDKNQLYETENKEWLDSLRWVLENEPADRVKELLEILEKEARKNGVIISPIINTPYVNTIRVDEEEEYPGNIELEEKILAHIRWNAMAMVVKANQKEKGIGGHISTYASIANLWEVGFNHFFKIYKNGKSDLVYFQGHAAPGVYARAFLEGRLEEKQLEHFRREIKFKGGLTSYPHPHLMPEFWNFPTVSMGLGAISAIYQARFNKYLFQRGLIEENNQKIWAFFGDGEMDEPEARGAINVAARNKLGNLTFVIDCNLQRLDGPVRGNGKIIQELESIFKGAKWNVIKVLWGSEWDDLFKKDKENKLIEILNDLPDGQLQKYANSDGKFLREDLFGRDERLLELVQDYSDEELHKLKRGGHDPKKIYNAFKAAEKDDNVPTIILAQTIKGYGQGKAGEASNVSHKTKKLNKDALQHFRNFFNVPVPDEELEEIPFITPKKESEELKYLLGKREEAGGFIPQRKDRSDSLKMPDEAIFENFLEGSGEDEAATTMVMVQILSKLLKDKNVGDLIVPIIPDESRTFGMESLFRQVGIYTPDGQQYEPVDKESLLYYKESDDGAILEEGITEAGCMSEFIAAGTAYLTHGLNTIPFYFFYSMFGFQRTGDLMWAAADAGAKGFLVGGISGRTSLPGEGLQHQDGQSQMYAYAIPNLKAYDPAFAYEVAIIVQEGIKRMYVDKEDLFYYITLGNATYNMPKFPKGHKEGILKGMYRYKQSEKEDSDKKAHLFGSGSIMQEVIAAAKIMEDEYGVRVDIWSITSYKSLYDDAIDTERLNRLATKKEMKNNYIQDCLQKTDGVFIAASDYLKSLPESIAKWFPKKLVSLGTDGFGRSDTRQELRDFFEVSANYIVFTTLKALAEEDKFDYKNLKQAAEDLNINLEKINPRTS